MKNSTNFNSELLVGVQIFKNLKFKMIIVYQKHLSRINLKNYFNSFDNI